MWIDLEINNSQKSRGEMRRRETYLEEESLTGVPLNFYAKYHI